MRTGDGQVQPAGMSGRRKASADRPAPVRTDELAHLTLDQLRAFRQALSEEENRVSYWRRIVQARLDLVRSDARADPAHMESLRTVLRGSRTGAGRGALVTIVPMDDVPPLPDLAELWERDIQSGEEADRVAFVHDLEQAERQLSAYRTALHERIGLATTELIARYREQPDLCLSALPTAKIRSSQARAG